MQYFVRFLGILFGTPERLLGSVAALTITIITFSPDMQQTLEQGLSRFLYLLFNYVFAIAITIWAICFIAMAPFKKGGKKK